MFETKGATAWLQSKCKQEKEEAVTENVRVHTEEEFGNNFSNCQNSYRSNPSRAL